MVKWILVLLLAIAPVAIGTAETFSLQFPAREPFFGQPISLLRDVILPSTALPVIMLGVVGSVTALVLTSNGFKTRPLTVQRTAIVGLALLTAGALWLGILYVQWRVIALHHSYWNMLFAPAMKSGPWLFVVGSVWTVGVAAAALYSIQSASNALEEHHSQRENDGQANGQKDEVSCSYPLQQKIWISVLALPFVLLGLLMVYVAASALMVTGQELISGVVPDTARFAGDILLSAFTAFLLLLFPFLLLSMYSDIHLSEEGIRVQVVGLWWILVPWEDVLDIRPTIQANFLGHRRSQLVFVRKLTFLHWIIGLVLGMRPEPAFNIKGTQTGYDETIRIIKRRLGKV